MKRSALFLMALVLLPIMAHGASKKYSIEFRQCDIKAAVRLMAKVSGQNVVVPDKIQGTVTASFDDMEMTQAIRSVLKANGYGIIEDDNVLVVISQDELSALGEDLMMQSFVLKHGKAEDVLPHIQSLVTARGTAVADARTNSIHVRDTRATIKNMTALLEKLDRKGQQVLIEAKIMEASLNFIRSLGIQWGVTESGGKVQTGGVTVVGTSNNGRSLILNTPATGLNSSAPNAGVGLILGSFAGAMTDVQLTTAEQQGDISILSRPSIVTMDNQAATIRSGARFFVNTGGDITIGTSSGTSGTSSAGSNNLEEIETGIELKVTPQVSSHSFVQLTIEAMQSEPDFTRAINGIPAVIDNQARTTVLLKNGETTIIGGLFKIRDAVTVKGIPGLMEIPLLGYLFKSTSKEKEKKELLILITPTIVEDSVKELRQMTEKESTLQQVEQERQKQNEKAKKKSFKKKKKKDGEKDVEFGG